MACIYEGSLYRRLQVVIYVAGEVELPDCVIHVKTQNFACL